MKKAEKLAKKLNDEFRSKVVSVMHEKFGVECVCDFNFFSMNLVTYRTDGKDFTADQLEYLKGFSDGYGEALNMAREEM